MRFIESNSDNLYTERKPPIELAPVVLPGGARSFAPSATLAGPQQGGQGRAQTPLFLRHKGVLVLGFLAGAAAGVLLSRFQTPVYTARAALEIESLNDKFMNSSDVAPTATNYGAESYVQTHIKLLQCPSLARRTADAVRAAHGRSPEIEPAVKKALASLKIRGSGLTRVVEIYADSTDPKIASEFVNSVTREYIRSSLEARSDLLARTTTWLNGELRKVRDKLEDSEAVMRAKAAESGVVIRNEKENLAEEKLKQIQDELVRAQTDRVAKQARFELARTSSPDSLPEVLDDTSLRDQQTKLAEVEREYATLSASLTQEHPRLVRAKLELDTVSNSIASYRQRIVQRISNDFESATRRETLLQTAYLSQAKLISGQSGKTIQYELAKRDVETNRALYDGMLQRVKEVGIISGVSANAARVVDIAPAPDRPSKPNRKLNGAAGAMLGCLLAVGFAVARQQYDSKFNAPGKVAAWLNVPELGLIPSSDASRTWRKRLYGGNGNGNGSGLKLLDAPRVSAEIAHWHDGPSVLLESFHATLASILFSAPEPAGSRTIVVTSASPGEGKTFLTCNLAIACAAVQRRVLLVDADFRKPRVHEIFHVANDEGGLSELVMEHDSPHHIAPETAVRSTQYSNLSVMPAGEGGPEAARGLFGPRIAQLLSWMRANYDIVLIDTPPVGLITDARMLGKQAEGVIVVLRSGRTAREQAETAMRRLVEDGTRIMGAVLNDWTPDRAFNAYGSNYYGKNRQSAKRA